MTDYRPTTADQPQTADGESPPLKDKATDAAEAAKQASADVAQTAAEKAKDVAQETSKQARDLVGEARQQVRQQVGTQHRSLVSNLRSLSDELSGMTAHTEEPGMATEAVGQLRDRVQGAADWLEGREPGDLVEELRSFARRRPGAFLLGAVAAGVVAGRLTRGVVAVHADDADTTPSGRTSQYGPTTQATPAPTEFTSDGGYAAEYSGYAAPVGNGETGYGTAPGYGEQQGYGTQPGYSVPPAGGYPQAEPQSDAPHNGEAWR
jgi:hypothetical protein